MVPTGAFILAISVHCVFLFLPHLQVQDEHPAWEYQVTFNNAACRSSPTLPLPLPKSSGHTYIRDSTWIEYSSGDPGFCRDGAKVRM